MDDIFVLLSFAYASLTIKSLKAVAVLLSM